jgi:hypothetical protein
LAHWFQRRKWKCKSLQTWTMITHAKLKLEKYDFFGVKSWFSTRNTPKIFAPPSARRNFFKCAPLTWNPGSAPDLVVKENIVFLDLSEFTLISNIRRHYTTRSVLQKKNTI